jgi:hypothetical protein
MPKAAKLFERAMELTEPHVEDDATCAALYNIASGLGVLADQIAAIQAQTQQTADRIGKLEQRR